MLSYVGFDEVRVEAWLPILNKQRLRTHLMPHELFDVAQAQAWVQGKLAMDSHEGCRVRAVMLEGALIGWCGVQYEAGHHELAIVLDDEHWGLGRAIFRDMMGWAQAFGHDVVLIHFLSTRPEYRFLSKRARAVYPSTLWGNEFLTYELLVQDFCD